MLEPYGDDDGSFRYSAMSSWNSSNPVTFTALLAVA
jgi:hypothetical protein